MKPIIPTFAILLLVALLILTIGDGTARGENPKPHELPPEQPGEPAITCPMEPTEEGRVTSLVFSPDSKALAVGNDRGILRIYDSETMRLVWSNRGGPPPHVICTALAYTPNGQAVAIGVPHDDVVLLDPTTGRMLRAMEPTPFNDGGGVRSLAISPDGQVLAGGYARGEVVLWQVATGRQLRVLPTHINPAYTYSRFNHAVRASPDRIGSLAFAPDGTILYTGSTTIRAWNPATGAGAELIRRDNPNYEYMTCMALSPDGATFATGNPSVDGIDFKITITLWDAATGRKRAELPTIQHINGLAFLPGGKTLVALEGESIVRLWDIDTAKPVAAVRFDHHYRTDRLAVSLDGRRIAAGGSGAGSALTLGIVQILDTDGGTLRLRKPSP